MGTQAIPHPHRTRVFMLAVVAIAVDTLMFSAIVPALPVYQADLGLSASGVALIFAAFPVAQLLAAPLAAHGVDRFGRRIMLVTGALLLAAAGVGFALSHDPYSLTIARAVLGASSAITWTSALAYVSDVYPPNQQGFRLSLAETGGGGAGLMAPLLSGILIGAIGLTETMLIFVAFPLVLAAWALATPETSRHMGGGPSMLRALGGLMRQRGPLAGAIALVLLAIVEGMVESLLPLDLTERLLLSTATVGLVASLGMATLFLGAPLGGRWSDVAGRRLPILVGGVAAAVLLPFIAIGPTWWVGTCLALAMLATAVMAAPAGPLFTHAVDKMGLAGSYGLSAGAMVMIFAVGFVLGPVVGAVLSAFLPFLGVCIAVSVIVLAGLAAIARLLPRAG